MLQGMRAGIQGWLGWALIVIISIPFALWGIQEYLSPSRDIAIAEVNGVEISNQSFEQAFDQQKRQLRNMMQQADLSFMDAQIRQDTLNRLIEQEILLQTAADHGMRIGDMMLAQRIHQFPMFQQTGMFSQPLYEQALRTQGMNPTGFEFEMRRSLLTTQLQDGITNTAFVSPAEVTNRMQLEKQQRSVSYLTIPTSRFVDKVSIDDAEINKYYQEHPDSYKTPEQVSIEYIELSQADLANTQNISEDTLKAQYQERLASFTTSGQWQAKHILIEVPTDATADKVTEAEKKATDILGKIKSKEKTFDEMAKEFSSDTSNKDKGGDLGWFGEGFMVKPFEDAVKAMKVGDLSDKPVKTQFGFHLIQLVDAKPTVTKPFEAVREELLKKVQQEEAEQAFYAHAEQMADLAFENPNSLQAIADTLKLPIKTTDLFAKTVVAEKDSFLSNQKVIEAAFSPQVLDNRYNSEVLELDKPQHIAVIRLKEHKPAQLRPLEEVKADITTQLKQDKGRKEAEKLGGELLAALQKGENPDALFKKYELQAQPAQWIERQNTTLGHPDIVREAFKMGHPADKQALYQGIALNNGDYALIILLAVKAGEMPNIVTATNGTADNAQPTENPELERLKTQAKRALGDTVFKQLLAEMKVSANIVVHQNRLVERTQ
ncbi:parvulin-like peptidyl-prolyl isomerase [Beggiatoa alba B18LD]|uniref:Periplasmic chaperone PpiD n=1 Tax=Beggiatoa alba B18LD TaxID=395493 RepID=I3CI71_9GAMM|nr:SurA N-terminal domain-containing protein [Beggiatoa alba]EIJ43314.1 parvulin-like peptidyl-prolyl isomerase [Beggiatoa alba B18LD]